MSISQLMPAAYTDSSAATMFAAMKQAKANTQAVTGTPSPADTTNSSSSSGSLSVDNLGSTFLSLLSQELQNQDPTQPIDPTAMVGQMISLNELDQLITINQTLSTATGGTASSGASSQSATQAVGDKTAAASSNAAGSSAAQAAANAAASLAAPNAAGALLAGSPAAVGTPSQISNLNSLYGGK